MYIRFTHSFCDFLKVYKSEYQYYAGCCLLSEVRSIDMTLELLYFLYND
jgi:hypothetical protein